VWTRPLTKTTTVGVPECPIHYSKWLSLLIKMMSRFYIDTMVPSSTQIGADPELTTGGSHLVEFDPSTSR
jgi:hypothetical protein